jgi:hypothetical protein
LIWRLCGGMDVLLGTRDVKMVARMITRDWWRPFGYQTAPFATEAKLRQVKCYMCYFWA